MADPVTEPVAEPVTEPTPTNWRDSLDADIKDHPSLTTIADVPALAKNFIETQAMVGRKGIVLPKEGDDGDLARFRTEIGVPDSADGYDLGDFAPPEGLPWSGDFQTAMLAELHKIGIPNGQIRQLLDGYAETSVEQYTSMQTAIAKGKEESIADLRNELGAKYTEATECADRVFKAAAGENTDALRHLPLADGTELGNHPLFTRVFVKIGEQYQEHGLLGEKTGGVGSRLSPDEAKAEIAALETHPAYHNGDHPEHKMIVDKMNDLYKQVYPEPRTGV